MGRTGRVRQPPILSHVLHSYDDPQSSYSTKEDPGLTLNIAFRRRDAVGATALHKIGANVGTGFILRRTGTSSVTQRSGWETR